MEFLDAEYTGYIIISLSSFFIGVLFGWIASKQIDSFGDKEVRQLISIMLILTYIVSVFAEINVDGYHTPMLLHAIIGGVVGYLFSTGDEGFNINIGGRK